MEASKCIPKEKLKRQKQKEQQAIRSTTKK